ncbi:MAG TPA: dihydrofolate reductase family protein [Ktedonobacterales bacterium]|jgi:dihydrofolate reductase
MRKIVVSEFMSLDGVVQAPGGKDEDPDGGFTQGGWTWPYWHDDIGALLGQEISEGDTLLLGRKTWQIHAAAFEPMADDDPNEPGFNAKTKYVVSTTLADASAWRNSTLIKDNVVEQVRALKEQPGKNILMDGSSALIHTLAQNDLIDEYSLLVYPVVLGGGKKVFADGARLNLRLIETKSFPTGVTYMRYAVERPASGE